jgi:uncharacterized protein YraI
MKYFTCRRLALTVAFLLSSVATQAVATARADDDTKSENASTSETGYVSTSKGMVYSGPSEDYYPTQVLPQGTAVEIYHRTDGGWLGIRPPGGSFSWVPASDAYLLPGGKSIEITSKNGVSWIGSSLGTAKQYRWQVRLSVGEQLTKLGEETIKDKDGKEMLWYKVGPPNGEFRWIQSGAVSRQPPAQLAQLKSKEEDGQPSSQSTSGTVKNSSKKANTSSDSKVVTASAKAGPKVKSANHTLTQEGFAYEGDSVEGEVIEGEVIDGGYVDGDVVDGAVMDGEVIEGEVIYEGEVYEDAEPQHDVNWNDWSLLEFTDQGLRFPFLERAAAWRATQPDPLCNDPFSLDLAPKKSYSHPGTRVTAAPQPNRRRTPWRDPRLLRDQRLMGYPQASGERGSGATFSELRGRMNSEDNSFATSPDQYGTGVNNGSSNGSDYYFPSQGKMPSGTNLGEPRLAPRMDNSARSPSNFPSSPSTMPPADMPNLPQDPFGNSNGGSGTWTGRNWFGLGQGGSNPPGSSGTSVLTGMQMGVEAAGNAVQQLQQRLSEMVTRPMQQWNFADLKERVRYYINNGTNPAERGQARLLLERIDEFERHAMRSGFLLSSSSNSASATPSAPVVTASYSAPSTQPNSGTMPSHNFDATGWLMPVLGARPNHPTHALKTDSGQVVAYVTALPGMNLESFSNQPVGIHGLRGFLPEFQAAHIEAQNITRLR